MTTNNAILGAAALADLLREPDPPTVLDASFTLTGGGRAAYDAGHIPGAIFVDLDRDLCGPPGAGGRHPLPDPADLQAALRRLGLRANHPIVVYEAGGPVPVGSAARVWWTLRWAGHEDVRVLDGGYAAWVEAALPTSTLPTSTEEPAARPGDFEVHPGNLAVWDAADAARTRRVLIDARVAPRFRGEVEPIDPVAGHIPGAVNQPVADTVDKRGRLLAPDALRARFEALGVSADRPVGAYCGSGITAAQTVLALHQAGFEPALYVGSWSHWITDAGRPVATGEG